MDLKNILQQLSEAPALAGYEHMSQGLFMELLAPYVDEISIDTLGNMIGKKSCGKPSAKHVLLEAHMDEIGFVVTGHAGNFLKISSVGSVDPRHLPGAKLCLLANPPQYGVVSTMPPHLLKDGDMDKTQDISELLVDMGLSAEKTKEILLGTPLVYPGESTHFPKGRFGGKALDNRGGMAAILLALSTLPKDLGVDISVLFSVQEEIGLRGAKTGGFYLNPDMAIVLDVTFGDTADSPKEKTVFLGKGPAIGVGPYLDASLSENLQKVAKEQKISHQLEILPGRTSTNADELQVAQAGVQTALLSLPLRYMHSPIEVIDLFDIEETAKLIVAFLSKEGWV